MMRARLRPPLLSLLAAGVVGVAAVTSLGGVDSQPEPAGKPMPSIRAIYGDEGRPDPYSKLQSLGVNTVHIRADRPSLNLLSARGMQAVMWLGEYYRDTCSFEFSAAEVEAMVRDVAGHPAVAAYQIADEPRATNCPQSPAHIEERSDLVKSIDDSVPTYVTVDSWNGQETYPYADYVGTTDIMGLVVYPCQSGTCDLSTIDDAIASAETAGVERYWAVVQGFADSYYSMPDAQTFAAQLDRWTASDAEGIAIFSWHFGSDDVSRDEEIQDAIRSAWVVDDPEPPPASPPPPAPTPTLTPDPTQPQPTSTSTVPTPAPTETPPSPTAVS